MWVNYVCNMKSGLIDDVFKWLLNVNIYDFNLDFYVVILI